MTEQAKGALSKVVIGFESVAYGTTATTGFIMPFVSSSLRRSRNKIPSRVIRGNFNPARPSGGNYSVSGQLVVPLDSVASWYWLKSMFNAVTTAAVDAVAAQGTITMAGLPVADETFVIDDQTFTWKASRSTTGEVEIGTDAADCVTNIVTAVGLDLTTVTAEDGDGDTVVLTAATAGTAGNSIVLTEDSTNMTVDGTGTLGGTTAGVAAGSYTHAFKMSGTTARTSLTIEHQYLDLAVPKYFQYTGCKISNANVTVGSEGEVMLTMDIVGSDRTIATSSFDGSATDLTTYTEIDQTAATLKEGGSTFADATNVTFAINFNPDTSQYVIGGGGKLGAIPESIIAVNGTLDALFKDTTTLQKAVDSTESSLEATYTNSTTDKVVIKVPELEYAESDPPIDGPQGLMVSLPYEGFYNNSSEAAAVVITLTNTEAHA